MDPIGKRIGQAARTITAFGKMRIMEREVERMERVRKTQGSLSGTVAAIHFDKRFVNFANTRNIRAMLLRTFGAYQSREPAAIPVLY